MVTIEKDVKVLAVVSALLFLCLILVCAAPFASGDDDTDAEPEPDAESLFLIVPKDYRTIFAYGNPILFGIAVESEHTGLTYRSGSGLTGIAMLNLRPGTYIIHTDAPDVDEPTTFTLILDAHYYDGEEDRTETYEVVIQVGEYNIGIIPDPEIIEEPEPEEADNSILFVLLAVTAAFAFSTLLFASFGNRAFTILSATATFVLAVITLVYVMNGGI